MTWPWTHGLKYCFGITTHTLWFWPVSHTSYTGSDFQVSFNLATCPR